jgi:Ca2+/Na+ antiporter
LDRENVRSLAIIGAVIVAIVVSLWLNYLTIASILGSALVVRFLQVYVYGGKKEESKENRKKEVQRQLTEVYSPVHHLISQINQQTFLGNADGSGFVGGEVAISTLDNFDQVRQIFIDHGHEFREGLVQQWTLNLRIHTRDLTARKLYFLYVNPELGSVLRELETNYQKLITELKELG